MNGQPLYRARASFYDRIYHWKDYAGEAARLRGLLAAAGVADGSRVLEAACGTGSYLAPLRDHFDVEGFDLSEEMLAVARKKLPGVHLFRADMADFVARRPADALLCLFSSLGYVTPGEPLSRVAACFFRALRPGGVALIEPWLTPAEVKVGHTSVQTYDGAKAEPPEALQLVRAGAHRSEGRKSVFDFHWLAVTPDGVEHFVDHHELWQSTEEELLAVFRGAGFETRWLQPGPLTGRALVLARRPA